MAAAASDSVGVPPPAAGEREPGKQPEHPRPRFRVADIKLFALLFLSFLLVSSGVFVASVVGKFGEKAVRGRDPTAWGTVIQGVCLVLLHVLARVLVESSII